MIPRPGSSQLFPGFVLILAGDPTDLPIEVHHGVLLRAFVLSPHTKSGPFLESLPKSVELFVERRRGKLKHRELHPTGDVDPDGVRNDGVLTRQDTTDGKAISHMGIGHECTPSRDGHCAGLPHLDMSGNINIASPCLVWGGLCGDELLLRDQFPGEVAKVGIIDMFCRCRDDLSNEVLQLGAP